MSAANWFYRKAVECGRSAEAAPDQATRERFLSDKDNWLAIAQRIAAEEKAHKPDK